MAKTLEEVKELVSELSIQEREELLAFLQKTLMPPVTFTKVVSIREYLPGESEEERLARVEAFMQELEETAIDIDSDSVEEIRQIRKERDEQIWRAATS